MRKMVRNVALLFLASCGAMMVAHMTFKVLVGRPEEIDIMMRIIVFISAGISLSTLVFASRRPLTNKQFRRRMAIHAAIFTASAAGIYASGLFEFEKSADPLGEGLLSFGVTMAVYALVAFLTAQQYRTAETSRQMNAALARYRRSTLDAADEGMQVGGPGCI